MWGGGCGVWVYVKMVCSCSPNKVRYLNLYREGDVTPYGCVLTECRVNRCWSELMWRGASLRKGKPAWRLSTS